MEMLATSHSSSSLLLSSLELGNTKVYEPHTPRKHQSFVCSSHRDAGLLYRPGLLGGGLVDRFRAKRAQLDYF